MIVVILIEFFFVSYNLDKKSETKKEKENSYWGGAGMRDGSDSPPVQISPVSSHFYPDQLHVLNTTSNGRKYSTSILNKPQRFPTKPTTQIDVVHCQALRHLLRRPPPPRVTRVVDPDKNERKWKIFELKVSRNHGGWGRDNRARVGNRI